ncbi:MAG: NAD(P)H-dependent glycerol-3-phosphate dehydrogenase [Mycobacteriales bacterium]
MTRAAVLGAGSWGTTFAKVLAEAGTDVVLWARRVEVATAVRERHENPEYLPGVVLPSTIDATLDPQEALAGADFVVLAVPSQLLRENLCRWVGYLPAQAVLVSLMKGVEMGTAKRMSEVITEVAAVPVERVAVVSGPNLAREIAAHQPTATVVACSDHPTAERLQAASMTRYFRPYTNSDVVGCELGGAVKNVIALACGMADGMGFGGNTMASIMTRGLAETARLGRALGADPLTFAGLAGMGDLVATCTSPLSRNRTFGERLGRGESVAQAAAATRQVAEGVKTCQAVLDLAERHGVDMPIIEAVAAVVSEGLTPQQMVISLMSRDARPERDPGHPEDWLASGGSRG